jgi:alkanesulfonate monooxygenase SsuD/methylene tetrahydromethanopterin reductase-like flavin-dependent oxidoreductase (luciferase family)
VSDEGQRPVQFGISLPNRAVLFGYPWEVLQRTAERAEASGCFDSVWVGDNLLSKPRLEAIVALSALATVTKRVKLGTVCLASFPLRDPLLFAIQWASLDVISGGRTMLAVCLGASAKAGPQFAAELAAMGVPSRERVPRLEEGIALLRRFWGSESVTFEGEIYRYENVDPMPKPIQERVPILLAVNPSRTDPAVEERALRRVAHLADGWQTDGTPPAVFRDRWQRIRTYAAEEGRADQVTEATLHLMVNINDDADAAYRESVEFLDAYYGIGAISDERLVSWLAFGPPEAVASKIAAFLAAGCTTPILRFTSPHQLEQIERCIGEIMPLLGRRPTAFGPTASV